MYHLRVHGLGENPLACRFTPVPFFSGAFVKLNEVVFLDEGLLAISSLSRALGGTAQLSDIGALMWVLLRQIRAVSDSLALFLPDDTHNHVVVRYAAGAHAHALRGVTRPTSAGVAGWVAVNRKPVLNAGPILDLGFRAGSTAGVALLGGGAAGRERRRDRGDVALFQGSAGLHRGSRPRARAARSAAGGGAHRRGSSPRRTTRSRRVLSCGW